MTKLNVFLLPWWASIFLSETLSAQKCDSIRPLELRCVDIVESRNAYFHEDKKVVQLDSSLRAQNKTLNLGELLSLTANVFVNANGSTGANSGVFMRGLASNQTSVNWNGFPINSITLGAMDLSMVQPDLMDNVTLNYGASGSLYGSGTFGGSIDLNNTPDWYNRINFGVNSEFGSFGSHKCSIKLNTGNSQFQYHLNYFYQHALNDFLYNDNLKPGNPRLKVSNNKFDDKGIMQNLFFKFGQGSSIDAGIWYQCKEKEIPALLGSYSSSQQDLRDSTLKAYIKWNRLFQHSSLTLKSAFMYDNMRYTDKAEADSNDYTTDSKIRNNNIFSDATYRYYFSRHLTFDLNAGFTNFTANVSSYGGKITENRWAFSAGAKIQYPRITANLSVRKEFVPDIKIKPLFSMGAKYMLKSDCLYLRVNGANKFRLPTFNDKYWQPGGNRDLKPEEGWTADMGLEAILIHDKGVQDLFLDVSAYTSTIRNMIVWNTTSPQNLKEVWARGVELSLNYSYRVQDFLFTMNAFYSHSPSTNIKASDSESDIIGKQIIYVPVQTSKAYMNLNYRKFYLAYSVGYTGLRYSSENNDVYNRMSPFACSNLYAGYTLKIWGVDGGFQFKVSNLADRQYQLMPGYAMPGRAYYVSLNLGIDKRKY